VERGGRIGASWDGYEEFGAAGGSGEAQASGGSQASSDSQAGSGDIVKTLTSKHAA